MAQTDNRHLPGLYWYDYETFGSDPRRDRPVQFAGLRTDLELNIIGDPLCIYCRPASDYLPHPEACLITGITPQQALKEGLPEAEFAGKIHEVLSQPNTCLVGYNNIRFDDEVTRFVFYRNFIDPYGHEWQNGNSRWDIIDMVRLTHALRPEGINWPVHPDGKPSFRLDQLTIENGISHEDAHDALSDVKATIAVAKLIRNRQPKLYDYVFSHRSKQQVAQLLNIFNPTPVLHVSSMYSSDQGCIALVTPLAQHPVNKNEIFVYDLRINPEQFFDMDVDELKRIIFTRTDDLEEGQVRLPVKSVHINKSPVVVPSGTLTPEAAEKWNINIEKSKIYAGLIHGQKHFITKLQDVFANREYEETSDPDFMLYSGGFFSNDDRARMSLVRETPPDQLSGMELPFDDVRLPEMLFRYRARNYPETLTESEQERWEIFRMRRLNDEDCGVGFGLQQYNQVVEDLRREGDLKEKDIKILDKLQQHVETLF